MSEEKAIIPAAPIPLAWLDGHPSRIVIHWSAGGHKATSDDRQHYHFIIEGDGHLVRGVHPISANDSTGDGIYAAHTRGANTKTIGIALAAMRDSRERPFSPGDSPITLAQWGMLIAALVQLCSRFRIEPTPATVLSHAEVEKNLGIQQRGKWDISVSPVNGKWMAAYEVGDWIREKVAKRLAVQRVQAGV